ncbi:unnamed protein product, partial [Durusdinium trenchii]
ALRGDVPSGHLTKPASHDGLKGSEYPAIARHRNQLLRFKSSDSMPRPSTGHSTVRAKAFFILLLLGGHEAVRIHEDVNLTALTYQNEDPMWEKVYRDMNKDCYWERTWGYCYGDGCVWKPFALDFRPHEGSCRKSDKYLLKTDPHNSMQMFAGILKAKSEKYAKNCQ